ncbi:ArnT family glycosyltransferase [Patescibacteria group bacterium]
MFKKVKELSKNLHLLIISLVAFALRLINLGYSDYQGDEIKSFFILKDGIGVAEFLLNQRKGPGQFIITWLVKLVNPNYANELITRLPFAIAGALAVFFFFKLVEILFNKKVAFYSALFFATNGFFVALARISQYQSFVILFFILAIYYMVLANKEESYRYKGIYLSFIFWALSILFHYDGVFIAPLIFYFLYLWIKENVNDFNLKDRGFKTLFVALAISGLMLAVFYVPFVVNISKSTMSYWEGRLSGEVSSKMSSSKYLFTVYQPIYVVHFYTILFLSGSLFISLNLVKKYLKKTSGKLTERLPEFSFHIPTTLFVVLWFLVSLAFFEGLVYIPGTHIYNYLIPTFIILALGMVFVEKLISLFDKYFIPHAIAYTGIFVLFLFLFLQSYAIYVDHRVEYPWTNERFLIWEFPKPTPIYHLSIFGFPYYRNWEGIRDTIMTSDNNGYYSTNERKSIVRFYIPFEKSTDAAGHFIYIKNPQSFTNKIQQDKAKYWSERYPPIFTFSKSGSDLVRVYQMEPGTVEEIKEKGF